MALSFTKKAAAAAEKPVEKTEAPAQVAQPVSPQEKPANVVSFMKRGASAKAAVAHEQAKAEERREASQRMRRYFIGHHKDGQITFLDGKLDADGMLDIPMWYEHRVKINGDWENFVCTAEEDQTTPCPICEKDDKPSLVGVMTVLDHSSYTVQKGPNAGKTYTNQRRLFVAKQGTLAILTKLAGKPERNGLAGCTFDVSRGGDKTPAVGDTFDFVCKYGKLSDIAAKFDLKIEDVQPADYKAEVKYRAPAELIELGVGKAHIGVGYEKGVSAAKDEL